MSKENNCNSGDGTGQMAQPWMFMMMMMMKNTTLQTTLNTINSFIFYNMFLPFMSAIIR
jgi:hypothetical protein